MSARLWKYIVNALDSSLDPLSARFQDPGQFINEIHGYSIGL